MLCGVSCLDNCCADGLKDTLVNFWLNIGLTLKGNDVGFNNDLGVVIYSVWTNTAMGGNQFLHK